jgi:hypothetical protein
MKQETLEEAAERFYREEEYPMYGEIRRHSFTTGAKWQQEQDKKLYSEEDMNDYANYRLLFKKPIEPKEWFEQFKKK